MGADETQIFQNEKWRTANHANHANEFCLILFSRIWRISRLRIRQKIKATTFSKRARLKPE